MGPGTARTDALKLVMRVPRMMVGRFSMHARHETLGTETFLYIVATVVVQRNLWLVVRMNVC